MECISTWNPYEMHLDWGGLNLTFLTKWFHVIVIPTITAALKRKDHRRIFQLIADRLFFHWKRKKRIQNTVWEGHLFCFTGFWDYFYEIHNVMMTSKSLRNWPAPQFHKAEAQNKMDQDQKNRLTPRCEEKKVRQKNNNKELPKLHFIIKCS